MQLTPELEDVGKRVRVLRDRVLVKQLPYVHPVLLTPGIEIQKGVVIAVGYGRRKRRKTEFRQSLFSSEKKIFFEDGEETSEIIPMDLVPGDVIEFSFRNITVVDFDRIGFTGIGPLVFVWRRGVYSVDPDESLNDCLLWQQSAGYDRNGNYMSGAEDWHRA